MGFFLLPNCTAFSLRKRRLNTRLLLGFPGKIEGEEDEEEEEEEEEEENPVICFVSIIFFSWPVGNYGAEPLTMMLRTEIECEHIFIRKKRVQQISPVNRFLFCFFWNGRAITEFFLFSRPFIESNLVLWGPKSNGNTYLFEKKKESNRFLQLTGFFFDSFEAGGLSRELPGFTEFFCSADLSSRRTWSYEDRNRMGTRIYLKKEKRVQLISAVQPTFYRVELGLVEFRVEWEGVDDVESHPRAGWLFGGSRWEPKWPSACLGKAAACAAAALFSFWPRLRGRRRPPGSCDAGRRRSVIYGPAGRVSLSLSLSVCVFACVFACVCVWLRSQHSNQAGSRPLFTQYGRYGAVLSWFRICFFFVFYVLSMETFCSFRLEPRTAVLWAIFCSIKSLISIPAFRVGCRWGPCHFYRKFLTFLLIFGKKKNKKWSPFDLTFFKMDAFDAECPEGLPSSVCFFLILFFCSFFPASFLYRSINRTRSLNWTPR